MIVREAIPKKVMILRTFSAPPKHVLHLVWSVLGISAAMRMALKVALYDDFDGRLAPLNGHGKSKP